MIRQPIIVILGHIDHGKTSLLDKIRGTAITTKEAGGITQAIGASIIPLSTIKSLCQEFLKKYKFEITIPGILFIDTPGHEAFLNLRRRGGSIANIAIVVVDINEGFKEQTYESIELLKINRVPFVIAANKVDLIPGWKAKTPYQNQSETTKTEFDKRIYRIVVELDKLGFASEYFERVEDFSKQIAIIPTSAKTGEGIEELLAIVAALAQKFLEKSLILTAEPKGTILEIKEFPGLGKVADVILWDGELKVGDLIATSGVEKPIITKIKALLEPEPLAELRATAKFKRVTRAHAATGIRIVAPGLGEAIPGASVIGIRRSEEIAKAKEKLSKEIKEVIFHGAKGVVVKADSLGSLEALITLLRKNSIPIGSAGIGGITKKDLAEAEALAIKEPKLGVILAFNIPPIQNKIKIFSSNIIYRLLEDYLTWAKEQEIAKSKEELERLTPVAKIQILKGYVFRQSNPAIVGIVVLEGKLRTRTKLIGLDGKFKGTIKSIEIEKKAIDEIKKDQRAAIALPEATVGRQIKEGDVLLTMLTKEEIDKYKELEKLISPEEKNLINEISKLIFLI